jgi:hypothetical protein
LVVVLSILYYYNFKNSLKISVNLIKFCYFLEEFVKFLISQNWGIFLLFLKSPGQAQLPFEEVIVVIPHPNSSLTFLHLWWCGQSGNDLQEDGYQ